MRPGRGLSRRPGSPWSRYRWAHLRTWRTLRPQVSAVSFTVWPRSSRRRRRPRRARPAGVFGDRSQCSISARSAGVKAMLRADLRPRMATPGDPGCGTETVPDGPDNPENHPHPSIRNPFSGALYLGRSVSSPITQRLTATSAPHCLVKRNTVRQRRPSARALPSSPRTSRRITTWADA